MSKSHSVKQELIANYAGRIWTVLANFLCVPLYVHWLGPESYGVVAFVTTIQSAATLFDFGFTTGISREVARELALGSDRDVVRTFVRTLEAVYWLIGLAICAGVVVLAGPISSNWLVSKSIAPHLIRASLLLGSIGILFTWPVTFYMGLMMGLNRQVPFNLVNTIGLTVRFGAATLVCWLLPHNLIAFFSAQAISASLTVAAMVAVGWHYMPRGRKRPVFRWAALSGARKFLTGMTLANAAALLFTQTDKIILSKWMPLEQFGYYSLAWTLGTIFYLFYSPVSAAFLPRFSALIAVKNNALAVRMFHLSCQLVAIGAFPTAAVLGLFAWETVTIWAHDPTLVQGTAPLLQLLVPFTAVGCIGYMPAVFQWSSGWTRITTQTYLGALIVLIPAMYFGYSRYGAAGAIVGWGIIRVAQSFAQIELMHTRLFTGGRWLWYRDAVIRPGAGALAMCLCIRAILRQPVHVDIFGLTAIWVACVAASFVCSPLMRWPWRRWQAISSPALD